MKEKNKYRLRFNNTIVGYAEESDEGLLFKGFEPKAWLREGLQYNHVDRFVGMEDKFHRAIYENDLVNYRLNLEQGIRKGVIIADSKEVFGILDLENHHFTCLYIDSISLFQTEKLEIYSHLFNHPDLEESIKK